MLFPEFIEFVDTQRGKNLLNRSTIANVSLGTIWNAPLNPAIGRIPETMLYVRFLYETTDNTLTSYQFNTEEEALVAYNLIRYGEVQANAVQAARA